MLSEEGGKEGGDPDDGDAIVDGVDCSEDHESVGEILAPG